MPPPPAAVRGLLAAARAAGPDDAPDPDLLRRFAAAGDAAAFEALVRRHAGLVWHVCRHVLRHDQDAEDAFQATFLVLARRAASVRRGASVAAFLHGTALRVALKARRAAGRAAAGPLDRPGREPEPAAAAALRELQLALAEEIDRLPAKMRGAFVVCVLEGTPRADAARALGVNEGTLSAWLARARERLRDRLTRRGVLFAAAAAALDLGRPAAAVPDGLIRAAVAGAVGDPPAAVAGLAAAAAGRTGAGYLLAAAVVVLGLAGVGLGLTAPPPAPATPPPAGAPTNPPSGTDAFGDPLPPGAVARLGTVRFNAGMWLGYAAASPDGRRLATTAQNFRPSTDLTVWDVASGRPLRQTELPHVQVEALGWSTGGRGFVVYKIAQADYAVWEFTDPAAVPPPVVRKDQINVWWRGTFTACAVSPDGRWVAGGRRGNAGSDGKLDVWAVRPNARLGDTPVTFTAEKPNGFVGLEFTPDGTRLVGFTRPWQSPGPGPADVTTVTVWEVPTGKELLSFEVPQDGTTERSYPGGKPVAHAFAPDGKTLYTTNRDGRVKGFDLATGAERWDAPLFPPGTKDASGQAVVVTGLALTPDGATLVGIEYFGRVAAIDARTGKELWRGGRDWDVLYFVAALPDGKRVVLGHAGGAVGVYDVLTGKPLNEQPATIESMTTVGFADGGRSILTTGGSYSHGAAVRRWDAATGRLAARVGFDPAAGRTIPGTDRKAPVQTVGYSPDGRLAVGVTGLFDVATGRLARPMRLDGLPFGATPVTWMPDGSLVASDGANTATRWAADGTKGQTYRAGDDGRAVAAVGAAPGGKTVVLAGTGKRGGVKPPGGWAAVFDAATGRRLREYRSATEFSLAAFTADGTVVLAGSIPPPRRLVGPMPPGPGPAEAVVLFDPGRGEGYTPFEDPGTADDFRSPGALAVSPSGYQVAVAEPDFTVTVYETASGGIRRKLRGHRNDIRQLAFSADGSRLASASRDGTGLVWDVAPPKPAAPAALTGADRLARWAALGSADAAAAHRAMGELTADPAGAVAVVRGNLKPVPDPTDADVDALVAGLDAAAFADRDAAARGLDDLGGLAVPRAKARLPGVLSAEARQRLEGFLKRHDRRDRLTGYRLRERRAVELLEAVGTPDARAALASLAGGVDTPLARDAAAAVNRLGAR